MKKIIKNKERWFKNKIVRFIFLILYCAIVFVVFIISAVFLMNHYGV